MVVAAIVDDPLRHCQALVSHRGLQHSGKETGPAERSAGPVC